MYSLEEQVESLADAFIESFPTIANEIAYKFGWAVVSNFESLINSQSGKLRASWQKGGEHNIFEVEINGGIARLKIGSDLDYAAIQNFGGSIPATEAMTRFFWTMWYQSKEEKWKWMALHTAQGLPIVIKPTHYLEDAMQGFKTDMDELLKANSEAMLQQIINEVSGEKLAAIQSQL